MKKVLIITRSGEFNPEKASMISKAINKENKCGTVQTVQDQLKYHPVRLKAFLSVMKEIDIHGVRLDKSDIGTIKKFYSDIQIQYSSSFEEWKNIYFSKPEMSKIKSLRNRDLWNIVTSIGEMRKPLLTDFQDFICSKIAEENKDSTLKINDVYVTFEPECVKDNIQVTLVLWDKLEDATDFVEKEYRLGLIKAICNDCELNESDENINGNMLYVHDKQWGLLNKQVELFNRMKNRKIDWDDEIMTKVEFDTLKKYFSYASCFQHTGGEGSLFNNICQLNFGSDFIERVCDEVERVHIDIFETKKYLDKQIADEFKN